MAHAKPCFTARLGTFSPCGLRAWCARGEGFSPISFTLSDCNACPADFNQDGGIDGSDVEAFFASWESGDVNADTNADGGVDGGDIETFFTA
ncbi:MAG: hypothetical protein NTV94_10960, partial [Planctomycetota bacterium]|nr:hypothetical protein [Planctomycetota bacterium]